LPQLPRFSRALAFLLLCAPAPALAAIATTAATAPAQGELSGKLTTLRSRVMVLQQELLDSLNSQGEAKSNVKKIQALLKLQREERELGKRRLAELERTVKGLEERRQALTGRVRKEQAALRRFLISLERARAESEEETELLEAGRRKALANLVDRGIKEVEALRVDLSDADQLETRIQEEKQQLAYLFQDLNEQESVLELNKQLQADFLRKNHKERVAQLEGYRKLKSAEAQVERLIGDFNARIELERMAEADRRATLAESERRRKRTSVAAAPDGGAGIGVDSEDFDFSLLKGRLGLPVADGKVISSFGRVFDPKTRLHIFKKGIDIAVSGGGGKKQPVHAVSNGKIAFSGELPDYGRVAIIDHGDHFYTLSARLGELKLRQGETVKAGDPIGSTDDTGTPVYFEIRARNVAVNPLQWLAN
jgi:septal ring factor EnvC (AmiA/AmiB activator)